MDLVVGATGFLGREICRQLRAQNRIVRGLVRSSSSPDAVAALQADGVEIVIGDLKQPASLLPALKGVRRVVSTASATVSRAAGDDIDSVDRRGQLELVKAAVNANVERFVFLSFPPATIAFPLQDAKREVEQALARSGMTYTVLQTPHFFEAWFSPALGFDAERRSARVFGQGAGRSSFVSLLDVAHVSVRALAAEKARNRVIAFGGPDAVSQRDVIEIFERIEDRPFTMETVPEQALRQQLATEPDQLLRSFAALMLICGQGDNWRFDNRAIEGLLDRPLMSARVFAQFTHSNRTAPS